MASFCAGTMIQRSGRPGSKTSNGYRKKHWVAECVVVELSAEGKWGTPRSVRVGTAANGSLRSNPVLKKSTLEDFFLADATDPGGIRHGVWVGRESPSRIECTNPYIHSSDKWFPICGCHAPCGPPP